jgi:chemotaxis protein CheX
MDVRYINPFVEAVQNLFVTMLETEIFISKPFVQTDKSQAADVTAVIGLSGDVVGSIALCFPMKSAVSTAAKFAGVEMSRDHEDFADALGELANIIAGQAKAKLEGLSCTISLPNVMIGENPLISNSMFTPRLVLPCDSALGRFSVEVSMVVTKQRADQTSAAARPL